MRNFILGVIVTFARSDSRRPWPRHARIHSDQCQRRRPPPRTRIAMSAVDASMERHAPHVTNPVPPTDQNLMTA